MNRPRLLPRRGSPGQTEGHLGSAPRGRATPCEVKLRSRVAGPGNDPRADGEPCDGRRRRPPTTAPLGREVATPRIRAIRGRLPESRGERSYRTPSRLPPRPPHTRIRIRTWFRPRL